MDYSLPAVGRKGAPMIDKLNRQVYSRWFAKVMLVMAAAALAGAIPFGDWADRYACMSAFGAWLLLLWRPRGAE